MLINLVLEPQKSQEPRVLISVTSIYEVGVHFLVLDQGLTNYIRLCWTIILLYAHSQKLILTRQLTRQIYMLFYEMTAKLEVGEKDSTCVNYKCDMEAQVLNELYIDNFETLWLKVKVDGKSVVFSVCY